ncbi:ARHGAP35 [Mytilus edulis]|uniref:ARHGAP35 n=1 Tax=Mytilus edulis TaxID=6550 RepID=A0A8S3QAX5_MYTED|nr:ARHGAP35 [Mytilus edulis]
MSSSQLYDQSSSRPRKVRAPYQSIDCQSLVALSGAVSGWLRRRESSILKKWTKKFTVLYSGHVYTYKNETCGKQTDHFSLYGYISVERDLDIEDKEQLWVIKIIPAVGSPNKPIYFALPSEKDLHVSSDILLTIMNSEMVQLSLHRSESELSVYDEVEQNTEREERRLVSPASFFSIQSLPALCAQARSTGPSSRRVLPGPPLPPRRPKTSESQQDPPSSSDGFIKPQRRARRDSSSINRELLRKRLFKNKRKSRSHGGADNKMFMSDDGRPRELSDLVRVIPQNSANKYLLNGRAPIPGSVVSRNDSMKNKFDHEQQQMYREGLATDKKILERSPSLKRPPGVPRLAFTEQDPDDIRVSIDNEENENVTRMENGINIGSDDELFLVGDNREQQPEQFFTHIRRPGQTTVRPLPANNVKPDMDDRRLRNFLEELYKKTKKPNTEPIIDERDLAEHGRGFLLERAEYWDGIGISIPRPPTTAVGLRLSRMNTNLPDSGRVYNIACASTVTSTPHPEQRQETPKQSKETFV